MQPLAYVALVEPSPLSQLSAGARSLRERPEQPELAAESANHAHHRTGQVGEKPLRVFAELALVAFPHRRGQRPTRGIRLHGVRCVLHVFPHLSIRPPTRAWSRTVRMSLAARSAPPRRYDRDHRGDSSRLRCPFDSVASAITEKNVRPRGTNLP